MRFGLQRLVVSPQLPADEDVGQSAGQTSTNQPGAHSHSVDQRHQTVETGSWELQQLSRPSLQPGMFTE